ncbi:MAG: hypothetical protein U9Q82_13530 [Chloroflexota bacterium]|nr:hypothetical protein [Chloroflexota bacterium]
MADINAFAFTRAVQVICDSSDLVVSYDIQILDDTVVKMRVILTNGTFIDVFHNADSGKRSYALIEEAVRVFGADNAFIGWHIHPFDNPSQHIPSAEISFDQFMVLIEDHFAKKQ